MRRNYSRIRKYQVVDPADIDKTIQSEIAGISYRLPLDRIRDFLFVVLKLNSVSRESIPKELQNLLPGQTVEMTINEDRINIRRTEYRTENRLQFFPDNPERRYTPREIMTMKELDSRARTYFERCELSPATIHEKIFRSK